MKHLILLAASVTALPSTSLAQSPSIQSEPIVVPRAEAPQRGLAPSDYRTNTKTDRVTVVIEKQHRGRTEPIPMAAIIRLCSDKDGCSMRLGLHNWDDTGRVASRESLFYYNQRNRAWRAELGDTAGTDQNNVTEHVMHAWSCYVTDGAYANWANSGDGDQGLGLLSWNEYNSDCFLVIVD
jgi:hypothetical protein